MKKIVKSLIITGMLLIISLGLEAQSWTSVAAPAPLGAPVNDLDRDSVNNRLFAVGNFTGSNVKYWNGTWNDVATFPSTNIPSNVLYVAPVSVYTAGFVLVAMPGTEGFYMSYDNLATWINLPVPAGTTAGDYTNDMCFFDNSVFIGGKYNSGVYHVLKLAGPAFTTITLHGNLNAGGSGDVQSLETYAGSLYISGFFAGVSNTSITGTGASVASNGILRINAGTNKYWKVVGAAISGGSGNVHMLKKHNGELYACGSWNSISGVTSPNLVKYTTVSSFTAVTGVNSADRAFSMESYGGQLYIATTQSGTTTIYSGISSSVSTLPTTFVGTMSVMQRYSGELYAGGSFSSPELNVAKYNAASSALTASTNVTSITCSGLSNGSVSAVVSGGLAPYSYSWSNGNITASITGLSAGTYTVTVTDALGSIKVASGIVASPAVLNVISYNVVDAKCFNGNSGAAHLEVAGGNEPYSFKWDAFTTGTSSTISFLFAGSYVATITDVNGCSTSQSFTINQPAALLNNMSPIITNVTCFGGSNGSIFANASGGTAPYTYSWSNGGTNATITGLSAGGYSNTVIDANGCDAHSSIFDVLEPSSAVTYTSGAVVSNVTCFGGSNGSISFGLGSGGTSPYSYSWMGSASTGNTASGLTANVYTYTVTDSKGCKAIATASVAQPAQIVANTSSTDESISGAADGSASVTLVSGGVAPYTYDWTASTSTDASINGLSAGSYSVTISDANSCTITETIIVGVGISSGNDELSINKTLIVYPNPSAESFNIKGEDIDVQIIDASGRIIQTLHVYGSERIDVPAAGIYFVKSSDGQVVKFVKTEF